MANRIMDTNVFEAIPDPMAPEAVAGGSFIPQQDPVNANALRTPEEQNFAKLASQEAKGKMSHINDFDLTLSGITDGDPAGMETFDLGFYEDGTPAIVINGANVPIRHEQWMSLLTMRSNMRKELKARTEFSIMVQKAKSTISRTIAAAPNIPPALGELLMGLADMDPQAAMNEITKLLGSMAKDGGRGQISKIGAGMQNAAIGAEQARLNEPIEIPVYDPNFKNAQIQTGVRKSTPAMEKALELTNSNNPSHKRAAYALQSLKALYPPPDMKLDPAIQGRPVGVFDIIGMEGFESLPLSRFDQIAHLAAFGGNLFPNKVDMVPPPVMSDFVPGRPADPNKVMSYRKYLFELDQWAQVNLKWDPSSPQAIDAMLSATLEANRVTYQPQQSQQQQQAEQPTMAQDPNSFTIELNN